MSADEVGRAASMEMAAAIFNGPSLLQMVAWRSFVARHEETLVDELMQLEEALQKLVELHERGLAQGGPERVTMEDVERLHRLGTLVSGWLGGGKPSAEIEPLARRLFALLGGDDAALPPEDQ